MTTLDPSHIPWLARSNDPTSGQAVHTSVPAITKQTARFQAAKAAKAGRISSDEEDSEDELAWFERRQRAHKAKKSEQEHDAQSQGRIPTLPLPDVRFEQSYLMSLRPFIRSVPVASTSKAALAQETPKKFDNTSRDKRRKIEESLALVEDPASRPGDAVNDLFSGGSQAETQLIIEWDKIVYVTLRDQLLSPLVQGVLWAFGGLVWGAVWSYWRGPPLEYANKARKGSTLWERMFTPLVATVKSFQ